MVFVWLLTSTVLGRANAIINELKANILKTNKNGFNFANQDFVVLKPLTELIFKVAVWCLLLKKCHKTIAGSSKNNQKKIGFKNVTPLIISQLVLVQPNLKFYLQFHFQMNHHLYA